MTIAEIIATLRVRYPAITTTVASDAYLESWAGWAEQIAHPSPWGARWGDAMVLLLAHRVLADSPSSPTGPTSGPLRSLSTHRMSASWGASPVEALTTSLSDAELSTTTAGRAYLALRATVLEIVMPMGLW